jgi:hypothetical protein
MPNVPTKLNAIIPKTTKTGTDYWVIETDAGKMSCFDYAMVEELSPFVGLTISIEYSLAGEKNQYKNFKSFTGPSDKTKFEAAIDERNFQDAATKDRVIMREVALKAAVDFSGSGVIDTVENVLAYAEKFFEWIKK